MPDYFSYIDTSLRIIHINHETKLAEDIKEKINASIDQAETSAHIRQHIISKYIRNQLQNDTGLGELHIHEFHHYLQGLFYPFLFYINWLEFDDLIHLRSVIKSSDEKIFKIKDFGLTGEFITNFQYTSQKFQLYWNEGRLWLKSPDEDVISQEVFTLNDLLEDVTTIFQYKLITKNPNADDFYEYILNPSNKCYRRLYKFLTKKLGKQFTYDLLPIFVQIAFTTTEPMGAFCNAVSYAIYNFQDYELFEREDIFKSILDKLEEELGSHEIDPINDLSIYALPNKVLKHTGIKKLIDFTYEQKEFSHYPFSLHARKFFGLLEKNEQLLFEILKIDKQKFALLLKTFEPMVIHYHFTEMKGRNGVLVIGKDYIDEPGPLGIDYPYYIKELLKVKEITQGLLTDIQSIVPGNCHHEDCAYHPLGLCKKYNSIPEHYKDCGFPNLFTVIFHRKINIEERTLDKISIHDVDINWDIYIQRSHKSRRFNYVEHNNNYVLTIGNEDFTQREKQNMFKDFIDYLITNKNETKAKLCSRITLDFYGFDDDPRKVNDIPDIKEWMQKTMNQVPEFLVYIDFSSDVDHLEMILPALIKHQYKMDEKKISWYLFDHDEKLKFLQNQIFVFAKFYSENPQTDPKLLFSTITKFYGN